MKIKRDVNKPNEISLKLDSIIQCGQFIDNWTTTYLGARDHEPMSKTQMKDGFAMVDQSVDLQII